MTDVLMGDAVQDNLVLENALLRVLQPAGRFRHASFHLHFHCAYAQDLFSMAFRRDR